MRNFVLIVVTYIAPAIAFACSNGYSPAEDKSGSVDVIFVGTPISIQDRTYSSAEGSISDPVEVRFKVLESIKGTDEKMVTVRTGYGGPDCGAVFTVGDQFVVLANEAGGIYFTDITLGTSHANNELVAKLRQQYGAGSP